MRSTPLQGAYVSVEGRDVTAFHRGWRGPKFPWNWWLKIRKWVMRIHGHSQHCANLMCSIPVWLSQILIFDSVLQHILGLQMKTITMNHRFPTYNMTHLAWTILEIPIEVSVEAVKKSSSIHRPHHANHAAFVRIGRPSHKTPVLLHGRPCWIVAHVAHVAPRCRSFCALHVGKSHALDPHGGPRPGVPKGQRGDLGDVCWWARWQGPLQR